MAIRIEITNLQKRMTLRAPRLRRIVQRILNAEGVSTASLSIVFVTDRKIHQLNKEFLGHDYATDVLAFDFQESRGLRESRHGKGTRRRTIDGEIIVSTDTAIRQANERGCAMWPEAVLYVVHGLLHLLGQDDHSPGEIRRMRQKEGEWMAALGYKNFP